MAVYPVRSAILSIRLRGLRIGDDERVEPGDGWSRLAVAQVVCTAEAIPSVSTARVSGAFEAGWTKTMRCGEFADLLP